MVATVVNQYFIYESNFFLLDCRFCSIDIQSITDRTSFSSLIDLDPSVASKGFPVVLDITISPVDV
jgi:hypothetical protein